MKKVKYIFLIPALIFISVTLNAQNEPPRLSPKASVSQVIGYTEVTIEYSRPGVKERDIWDALVPYDEVWRTGANEATTISFTDDVMIEGKKVPKGEYSLFTIPSDTQWTIILNKISEQWGAFNYNEADDVIRVKVNPRKGNFTERLLVVFDYVSPYASDILFKWEWIEVPIRIETF